MHKIFLLLSFVLMLLAALRGAVAFRNPDGWAAVKDDVVFLVIGAVACFALSAYIKRSHGKTDDSKPQ